MSTWGPAPRGKDGSQHPKWPRVKTPGPGGGGVVIRKNPMKIKTGDLYRRGRNPDIGGIFQRKKRTRYKGKVMATTRESRLPLRQKVGEPHEAPTGIIQSGRRKKRKSQEGQKENFQEGGPSRGEGRVVPADEKKDGKNAKKGQIENGHFPNRGRGGEKAADKTRVKRRGRKNELMGSE